MRTAALRLSVELVEQVSEHLDDPREVRDLAEVFQPEHTGVDLYQFLMKRRETSPAHMLQRVWSTQLPERSTENVGVWTSRVLNGVDGIAMKPACVGDKSHAVAYDVADRGVRIGSFARLPEEKLQALLELVAERHLNEVSHTTPPARNVAASLPQVGTYIPSIAVGASHRSFVGSLAGAYWSACQERSPSERHHRPLHVVHSLLDALMLESLTRWCSRSSSVQDLRDRQRVSKEALQTLQELSLKKSFGSLHVPLGQCTAEYSLS